MIFFKFLLSLVMIERMLEFILKEVDGYFLIFDQPINLFKMMNEESIGKYFLHLS
jgi:hypothetical protein